MTTKHLSTILLFFIPFLTSAQTRFISRSVTPNNVTKYILIDNNTKTTYILDSTRITISAIDSSGHLLWKTDPWKDNKLPAYRTNRPTIVTFYTTEKSNKRHKKKDAYNEYNDNPDYIAIGYSNSQFGYILKKNGSFKFMGQD
jgi:hypothetical protein